MAKELQMLEDEYARMSWEQHQAEPRLFALPNVIGVALGMKVTKGQVTDRRAIQVLVDHKVERSELREEERVFPQIGDYPTDVLDVGEIFAQPWYEPAGLIERRVPMATNGATESYSSVMSSAPMMSPSVSVPLAPVIPYRQEVTVAPIQVLRQRVRPVLGGFSVGHPRVTAGTVATCCYDLEPFPGIPSRYYILSNNHVLANSNDANIGDPILQPGPADGGTLASDVIGRLARFVPIKFRSAAGAPLNYVDAAVAEVPFHEASREIYWVGYLSRRAPGLLKVGDIVQKTGRTTSFSTGKILSLNATVDVNYGSGRVARFAQQIIATAMSAGGDSGSLVTDTQERAVGLLFAGSTTHTIINPVGLVQSLLKVRLTEN